MHSPVTVPAKKHSKMKLSHSCLTALGALMPCLLHGQTAIPATLYNDTKDGLAGNTFTIIAHDNSSHNPYIRKVKLNGKP